MSVLKIFLEVETKDPDRWATGREGIEMRHLFFLFENRSNISGSASPSETTRQCNFFHCRDGEAGTVDETRERERVSTLNSVAYVAEENIR